MNAAQKNNQAANEPVPFTKEIADNILLIAQHVGRIYGRLDETDRKIEATAQRLSEKIESTAQMLNDKIDAVPEAVVSRAEVRRTENRVNALEDKMHVISGKLKIDWKTA